MSKFNLITQLTLQASGFNQGLDKAKSKTESFGGSVKKIAGTLGLAFGAAAIVNGIKNMVKELTTAADRLLDLEQMTGLSTDRLQEYEHVARKAGVQSETMATAVQDLTLRLASARKESSPLLIGLKELGVNMKTSSGEMRNGGEVMEEVIEQLAGMDNITKRNVLGAQIFAGSWKNLAPVLALGADGIEAAREEAHKLGLVLGKDSLNAANELRIEMETLNAQWTAMKRGILLEVVPALTILIKKLNEGDTAWQKFFSGFGNRFIDVKTTPKTLEGLDEIQSRLEEVLQKYGDLLNFEIKEGGLNKEQQAKKDYYKWLIDNLKEREKTLKDNLKLEKELAEKQRQDEIAAKLEEERLASLKSIKSIQDAIKIAKEEFNDAETDYQRKYWSIEIAKLETKLDILKDIREEYKKISQLTSIQPGIIESDEQTESIFGPRTNLPSIGERDSGLGVSLFPDTDYFDELIESLTETDFLVNNIYSSINMLSDAFIEFAQTGELSFAKMTMGILSNIRDIITAKLAEALMGMIAGESSKGLIGLLTATAGITAIMALVSSKVPKFHSGGIVTGTGEVPALLMPNEMVITPSQQKNLFDMANKTLNYGGEVTFKIKGDTLVGVLNNHTRKISSY